MYEMKHNGMTGAQAEWGVVMVTRWVRGFKGVELIFQLCINEKVI